MIKQALFQKKLKKELKQLVTGKKKKEKIIYVT